MKKEANNRSYYINSSLPEVRTVTGSDGSVTVCGYSAIYNSRSRLLRTIGGNSFYEEIAPGAFDDTDFSDMLCNFDHVTMLCRAPTLRIRVDNVGLYYEYQHDPLDPDHVGVLRKIQRGDVTGCSFAFSPPLPGDEEVSMLPEGIPLRRVLRVRQVFDVGPVARPAYMQTGVYARSVDEYALSASGVDIPVSGSAPEVSGEISELTPEASGSEMEDSGIQVEVPVADAGSEAEASGSEPEDAGSEAEGAGSEVEAGGSIAEDAGSEVEGPAYVPSNEGESDSTGRGIERGIDREIISIWAEMAREPYYHQLI